MTGTALATVAPAETWQLIALDRGGSQLSSPSWGAAMNSFARVVREVPLIVGGESVVRDAGVAAAETEARRQALLAEAKAFREGAARIAIGGWPVGFYSWSGDERDEGRMSFSFRSALARRVQFHEEAGYSTPCCHDDWVLVLLWLALECEDEAQALKPAKRRRQS